MKPVEVIGIDVSYGAKKVLEVVSLDAEKGEILGIIGPNGAGKTTLIKAMSRVVTPEGGEIHLNARNLESLSFREMAQQVAVVPQGFSISFDYSVRDIVMMGRHPYIGRLSSASPRDLEVCDNAMRLANVTHLAASSVNEISGGERQRVLIARALAQEPKILLLDEATSNLDISHRIEILDIIRGLTDSVTVISVFHDLNLAAYYCDRLIMLKDQRVFAVGEPADVLTREAIRAVYGIDVLVKTHPLTGKPYILPVYGNAPGHQQQGGMHVICGGGTGSDLLYALHREGFRVSAGVLNLMDTDYATATALGIPCISEAPFAAISAGARDSLRQHIDSAHAVIVTAMPIGPGNIENIRILEDYRYKSVIFLCGGGSRAFQDHTGGEAGAIIRRLFDRGAVRVERVEEVLRILRAAG
ncbi:MAG: ABC transporter ATP-binding protein [Methanomicrobiales archaeon]|nr:ABC transporter ATP-binding protein [Methanomicrobiales archaeon]